MRKCAFFWLVFVILACQVGPLAGAQADVVGRLTQVEGRVDILRGGQLPATPVKVDDGVQTGDVLRTKSLSKAQITFIDNTTLTVSPESRVAIEEYMFDPAKQKRSATLQLFQGLAHVVVSKVFKSAEPDFVVKTQTAIMGIRGTEFGIRLQPNGSTILNFEGVLQVGNIFPEVGQLSRKAFKVAYSSSRQWGESAQGWVQVLQWQGTFVGSGLPPTVPFPITLEDRKHFMNQMGSGVNLCRRSDAVADEAGGGAPSETISSCAASTGQQGGDTSGGTTGLGLLYGVQQPIIVVSTPPIVTAPAATAPIVTAPAETGPIVTAPAVAPPIITAPAETAALNITPLNATTTSNTNNGSGGTTTPVTPPVIPPVTPPVTPPTYNFSLSTYGAFLQSAASASTPTGFLAASAVGGASPALITAGGLAALKGDLKDILATFYLASDSSTFAPTSGAFPSYRVLGIYTATMVGSVSGVLGNTLTGTATLESSYVSFRYQLSNSATIQVSIDPSGKITYTIISGSFAGVIGGTAISGTSSGSGTANPLVASTAGTSTVGTSTAGTSTATASGTLLATDVNTTSTVVPNNNQLGGSLAPVNPEGSKGSLAGTTSTKPMTGPHKGYKGISGSVAGVNGGTAISGTSSGSGTANPLGASTAGTSTTAASGTLLATAANTTSTVVTNNNQLGGNLAPVNTAGSKGSLAGTTSTRPMTGHHQGAGPGRTITNFNLTSTITNPTVHLPNNFQGTDATLGRGGAGNPRGPQAGIAQTVTNLEEKSPKTVNPQAVSGTVNITGGQVNAVLNGANQIIKPVTPVVVQTIKPVAPVVVQAIKPVAPIVVQAIKPVTPVVVQAIKPATPVVVPATQTVTVPVTPTVAPASAAPK